MESINGIRRFRARRAALMMLGMLGLAACGGGGSASSQGPQTSAVAGAAAPTGTGSALVTLTDAPGDFLSYLVNVVSLQLTRADGTVIETVPVTTQVDFAQLVNLSEVVSAQQIPAGAYVAATLTLDYSGATIVVDNGAGGLTVPAANVINGSTSAALVSPNNRTKISLELPSGSPLVITPGTVGNLALDFNLAASNTVTPATIGAATAAAAVTVTVNPVLTASLVPDTQKQIRVRGALVSVTDAAGSTSYTVNVRPFYNDGGSQGQLVVDTTASTTFTINGSSYSGSAGLTALAALAAGTLTSANGSFDVATKTFTAAAVSAGTNKTGAILDSVEGTVVARSGNVVTLSDGLICPRNADVARFGFQVVVTIGASTSVTEAGQTGTFGPQDISVGQHVLVFGNLTIAAGGSATLDATQGSAQLRPTALVGLIKSATADTLTVTLQSLDGQPATSLDFSGTGASTAQDASAAGYLVGVPNSLLGTPPADGTPVKLVGFVAPFGTAPPDFAASSLESFANAAALLRVEWSLPGLAAPFVAPLSAAHVVISQSTLQGAKEPLIHLGPQLIDVSSSSSGLTLTADAAATNPAFAIAHGVTHRIDTFTAFTDLISALTSDLNGTTTLVEIEAKGAYDAGAATLSADQLVVLLDD